MPPKSPLRPIATAPANPTLAALLTAYHKESRAGNAEIARGLADTIRRLGGTTHHTPTGAPGDIPPPGAAPDATDWRLCD